MITVAITKFKTVLGKEVICRLKSSEATHLPVYEFISSGSPLWITSGANSATEVPILTSMAELSIENIEPFRAMKFMTASPKSRMLEVEHDGNIIWSGFMVPDQWYENFSHTPYFSRFTFIDGLALLHHEKYVGDDGTYIRGRLRDCFIVGRCLSMIGLNRQFVDQINIFDVNVLGVDFHNGTLWQHWKDQEAFRNLTCYEILAQILISYKARIEFYNNRYYISRIDNTDADVYSVYYHFAGTPLLPNVLRTAWEPNRVEITPGNRKTNRFCWQETSQSIEKIPGWKSFEFAQIYGKKESMLARHKFEHDDWTASGSLKNWNIEGVDKIEIEDTPAARFIQVGPITMPDGSRISVPYRGHISQIVGDSYSPVNVTADNFEQFILEIETQVGTFQYSQTGTYYGPRVPMGGLFLGEVTHPAAPAGVFSPVDQFLIGVRNTPSNSTIGRDIVFHVSREGLLGRQLEIGSTLIFRDTEKIPKPFAAGIVYKVVQIMENATNYWFRVNDEFPVSSENPYIVIDPFELNKTYFVSFWFVVLPCHIQILHGVFPQESLGLDGIWVNNERKYLYLEVQKGDIDSKRKFVTGITSETKTTIQQPGRIFFKLDRPRDTAGIRIREASGTWYIQAVRLFFADVPEKYEKTVLVNAYNTRTGEVVLHFAETPIKTNFPNNNLKFFNNFYSLSTTEAPGLQYQHNYKNIITTQKEIGVYGFLYNKWAANVIANTSTHVWRVSSYEDVKDLANLPGTVLDWFGNFNVSAHLLKSTRLISVDGHPGWLDDPNSTDIYNFNLLPAGARRHSFFVSHALDAWMWLGDRLGFWLVNLGNATIFYLLETDMRAGYSIRLCRDLLPGEELIADGSPGINYIGNDGKSYHTVKINNRIWIGEFLRETKTNNGTDIPRVDSQTAWNSLTDMAYCYVLNQPDMSFRMVEVLGEAEMNRRKANASTLQNMVINFYKRLYHNSRLLLSGVINANGSTNPFGKILQEKHTERDYIRMETVWDVHKNTFQGIWHELRKTVDEGQVTKGSYSNDYNKKQYN